MLATQAGSGPQLDQEFKQLAEGLCTLLQSFGMKTRPYHDGTPFFTALTPEKKSEIIQHLRFYYELCSDQVSEGQSLRDSQTFTWRALKKCGLVPNSNFISQITSGDLVEIYTDKNVQIFRNLEFFEFCSYTLEDLYCCEWWKLYRRNDTIINILMNCVSDVFAGEFPEGVHYPVQVHELEEIASADRNRIAMDVKFVGPLYTNKSIKAIIAVEGARFLLPGERLGLSTDFDFKTI